MKLRVITFLLGALLSRPSVAADFSTPEGALRALESACIAGDIEAAVAAKNILYEAKAMLVSIQGVAEPDPDLVIQTAEILELAFRKEMKEVGFPKFAGLKLRIISTRELAPGLAEITEEITFPDGYVSQETINAARSGEHWGIVVLPKK